MSLTTSRQNLFLILLLCVAAFFRLYRLDQIPPGFQFDQAYYVFDALRLLQGQFSIFFAAPGGSEPIYLYLTMVGTALFGISPFGLKLTSAIIGTITVPLVYGFARSVFNSSRIAGLAALLTATSVWHVFFSRSGERVTLLVLFELLTFWFFWRALQSGRARDYILSGVGIALGLYTYPAARVMPVALVALGLYACWANRARAREQIRGTALALVVAGLLFLPLGVYFVAHPDDFLSHSAQVSIFVPHGEEQGNILAALFANAERLLKMFLQEGDMGMLRNIPGRPVFDIFSGVLFVLGIAVAAVALFSPRSKELDRRRAVMLSVWIGVSLGVSLFTDDAPNFVRTLPAVPAVMILPAWGAQVMWDRLRQPTARKIGVVVLSVLVAASAWQSYRDYFLVYANDPGLYYVFNADKVDVSDWINRNAGSQTVFLAPVWYQVGTISLLTRNAPLKTFESRDTIVLPSVATGKDAIYIFPNDQERKAQTMQARLGDMGRIEKWSGSNGQPLFLFVRIRAANLPDPATPLAALGRGGEFVHPQQVERAGWNGELELIGRTLSPEGQGGRNLTVTLFLHSFKPIGGDYTFSVKARDKWGHVYGQDDKWPGNNSYATTAWSAGDVVVEKFYPGLDPCAPAGDYEITLELYYPQTMQVMGLDGRDGNVLSLGSVRLEASSGNRLEDLSPAQSVDIAVAPRVRLFGTTVSPEIKPGEPMGFSLFWSGSRDGTVMATVKIDLIDASSRKTQITEGLVSLPAEGRGLCTRYDVLVPGELAGGPATLSVNGVKIATLNVVR